MVRILATDCVYIYLRDYTLMSTKRLNIFAQDNRVRFRRETMYAVVRCCFISLELHSKTKDKRVYSSWLQTTASARQSVMSSDHCLRLVILNRQTGHNTSFKFASCDLINLTRISRALFWPTCFGTVSGPGHSLDGVIANA